MKTYQSFTQSAKLTVLQFALMALQFAKGDEVIAPAQGGGGEHGVSPTNQAAVTTRTGKVIRVQPNQMKFGQPAQRSQKADSGEKMPALPPLHCNIEFVPDGEFEGAVKVTTVQYGWPLIKEVERKTAQGQILFEADGRTPQMTKRLQLATTRSAVAIMDENVEEGQGRQRKLIDIETEEGTLQFGVTLIQHVYGKAEGDITKRETKAQKEQREAQAQAAPPAQAAAQGPQQARA